MQRRILWSCRFSTSIQPSSMWNFNDIKRVYKGSLITGSNYLGKILQRSIASDMNLFATTSGKCRLHWICL